MAFLTLLAFPLLLLPFLCLLLLTIERKKTKITKEPNLPPGPTNLPIIGNLHKLGLLPHRSLFKLSQEQGPLMYLKLASIPTVVASSADTAKELLKTHDLETCSRPRLTPLDRLSYGSNDVACAPYGDRWKELRKNIFVAGSETSSTLIEWVFAELMRNPSVMKKAQDEVRTVVRSKGKVEEIDLDQLHYLNCIIKEVMRMHPPIPLLLQRETIQHCRINNYDIPPRTRLLINPFAIGRDANVWENADKFCPERFIDSSIDFRGHDFELIPFGAGRRICPGMNVGILVVELALANLLYSFNWELPTGISEEDIDMTETPGIAVHRKSDLRLVAKRYK